MTKRKWWPSKHTQILWAERVAVWFLIVLVCLVVGYTCAGCASAKKWAYTASGAAGGAAAGAALAGPGGAAVGGAAGAVTAGAVTEVDEYRDGDVIGEEAMAREMERLRRALAGERIQSSALSTTVDTLKTWALWGAVGLGLWFLWRNRVHLRKGPHGLWHAIWGGK